MKNVLATTVATLAILAVVGLTGCSALGSGGSLPGNAVTITGYKFTPASGTVKVGDTVTWTNKGDTAHTVTIRQPQTTDIDSGAIPVGKSYSYKFDQAGTYEYYCRYHTQMVGTITVK